MKIAMLFIVAMSAQACLWDAQGERLYCDEGEPAPKWAMVCGGKMSAVRVGKDGARCREAAVIAEGGTSAMYTGPIHTSDICIDVSGKQVPCKSEQSMKLECSLENPADVLHGAVMHAEKLTLKCKTVEGK